MKKHSIRIAGHPTSISLEEEFWNALKKIAERRKISVPHIINDIDEARGMDHNLSSAIRVFVLNNLSDETDPSFNAPDNPPA